jgi:hypothetical protein
MSSSKVSAAAFCPGDVSRRECVACNEYSAGGNKPKRRNRVNNE